MALEVNYIYIYIYDLYSFPSLSPLPPPKIADSNIDGFASKRIGANFAKKKKSNLYVEDM